MVVERRNAAVESYTGDSTRRRGCRRPFGLAVTADCRLERLEHSDVFFVRRYPVGSDFLAPVLSVMVFFLHTMWCSLFSSRSLS